MRARWLILAALGAVALAATPTAVRTVRAVRVMWAIDTPRSAPQTVTEASSE